MLKIPTLEEGVGIRGINTNIVYHSAGFTKHAWLPQCAGTAARTLWPCGRGTAKPGIITGTVGSFSKVSYSLAERRLAVSVSPPWLSREHLRGDCSDLGPGQSPVRALTALPRKRLPLQWEAIRVSKLAGNQRCRD